MHNNKSLLIRKKELLYLKYKYLKIDGFFLARDGVCLTIGLEQFEAYLFFKKQLFLSKPGPSKKTEPGQNRTGSLTPIVRKIICRQC